MNHDPGCLLCPVCFREARVSSSTLSCSVGHSFDRAKQGYFNLDLSSGAVARGDTADQVGYREMFLSRGCFEPIIKRLAELALTSHVDMPVVLDAGVGSGHYLREFTRALAAYGRKVSAIGLDVSKACVSFAAKRQPSSFMGVYNLRKPWPLMSESLDVVINAFSPHNFEETRRSLKA